MSEQITTIFVLTGPLKGKSVSLGSQGFNFVDGKMEMRMSTEDTDKISRFLKRNWQAVPEQKFEAEPVKSNVAPKATEPETKKTKVKEQ